jgi:TolB-like protein
MNPPSLWDRLRRARAVQITVAYLAASWFVLQLVATVQEMLALPAWVGPVTILLLVVGLFVVGATAWVQSLERTTAGEEAGELPTDWEIAPSDALESLKAGRLPHLTWGRAILGGVVSISLMVGVAGGYVLLSEREERMGPSPAGASGPAQGIAVLPFTVSGTGLEPFAEGMVSLVSTNIDGVDGVRSINPRTVMAQWEESFGDTRSVALDDALRAAGSTGARYAVLGDAVSTGPSVRFTAELYDLDTGERLGSGRSEGATDGVLGLIDEMSIDLLRTLLAASGRQSSTGIQRLERPRDLVDRGAHGVPGGRGALPGGPDRRGARSV